MTTYFKHNLIIISIILIAFLFAFAIEDALQNHVRRIKWVYPTTSAEERAAIHKCSVAHVEEFEGRTRVRCVKEKS